MAATTVKIKTPAVNNNDTYRYCLCVLASASTKFTCKHRYDLVTGCVMLIKRDS